MKSDNLEFLKNLSYKLNCPLCKKLIYKRTEVELYDELQKHLEDCKKNRKVNKNNI